MKLIKLCKTKKKPNKRFPVGGKKPRIDDLEEYLIAFIDAMCAQSLRVTCSGY